MSIEYKPVGKYDTPSQGYDESLYDNAALNDSIAIGVVDAKTTSGLLAKADLVC